MKIPYTDKYDTDCMPAASYALEATLQTVYYIRAQEGGTTKSYNCRIKDAKELMKTWDLTPEYSRELELHLIKSLSDIVKKYLEVPWTYSMNMFNDISNGVPWTYCMNITRTKYKDNKQEEIEEEQRERYKNSMLRIIRDTKWL